MPQTTVEISRSQRRAARLKRRTIDDFGEQWEAFRDNAGYYGSQELLQDILGCLLSAAAIRGCRVADIGSGTGRIVNMLLRAGCGHVTALEPSSAFAVLRDNVAWAEDRVRCMNVTGEELPAGSDFDYVFSVGVLHHIPEPAPTVASAFSALRPGGRIVVWVYGVEGNRLYLTLAFPLRALTRRLPHRMLAATSWAMLVPLWLYIQASRVVPLPMRGYMLGHLGKLSANSRMLTVYDQLNPAYAKYYRASEVRALLESAGFVDVQLHHRHGYSWTAIGTKPGAGEGG